VQTYVHGRIDRRGLLRLVNAPAREARETAEKLSNRNDRNIKLTLFSLQKFIRVSFIFLAPYHSKFYNIV
jgi:hypothetical protein